MPFTIILNKISIDSMEVFRRQVQVDAGEVDAGEVDEEGDPIMAHEEERADDV